MKAMKMDYYNWRIAENLVSIYSDPRTSAVYFSELGNIIWLTAFKAQKVKLNK